MKKNLNNQIISYILLTFIFIQSIIDLQFLASYNSIQIIGFTIPTIIRLIGVFIIFIFLIFSIKLKQYYPFIFFYLILIIIYFYFHHQNTLSFTSLSPTNFSYNILEEIFYIIRLLIPIFVIFVTSVTKINEKKIQKLIFLIVLLISGSIVISNVFAIGYGSYNNNLIQGSIINWFFKNNYDFYKYATKGWFANANAISSLLVLLLPIVLYYNTFNKNWKWFLILFIQMLSMIMIGTKVATWGLFLELIIFIFIYLFFSFIKCSCQFDYKILIKFILIGVCVIIIYPFSPCYQRIKTDKDRFEYSDQEEKIKLSNFYDELNQISLNEKYDFKVNFIKNEYENFSINPKFIVKSYNYKYDPDFWISIFESDYQSRTNYRLIEQKMFNRLKEIDQRKYNDFLGLTFSRLSKIFTLEKDFLYQYYTLGLIGLILLVLIYIMVIIYIIIKILFFNKKQFNIYNISFIMGISICLASAYMSGNVIDTLMVMILLGFLLGHLLKNVNSNPNF